jgi:hypothetical protein
MDVVLYIFMTVVGAKNDISRNNELGTRKSAIISHFQHFVTENLSEIDILFFCYSDYWQ